MGTNFYVRGFRRSDEPEHHLGKRSASGAYCWDCKVTLCMDGESGIATESLENSSAGRELGFNKSVPAAKKGVSSCLSFSWGMTRVQFDHILETTEPVCCSCDRAFDDKSKIIEDEYGRTYIKDEFLNQVLAECPVQYWEHVGKCFS